MTQDIREMVREVSNKIWNSGNKLTHNQLDEILIDLLHQTEQRVREERDGEWRERITLARNNYVEQARELFPWAISSQEKTPLGLEILNGKIKALSDLLSTEGKGEK